MTEQSLEQFLKLVQCQKALASWWLFAYAAWRGGFEIEFQIKAYTGDMKGKLAAVLGINPDRFKGDPWLKGGNVNFWLDPELWNHLSSRDTCQSGSLGTRCASNVHFGVTNGVNWVHMDSANPYIGLAGVIWHGIVDVIGGNTIFAAGVPH